MDERVLGHLAAPGCRAHQNPPEIGRKDILRLQRTLDGGSNRVVFEAKVPFVFFLVNVFSHHLHSSGEGHLQKQGVRTRNEAAPLLKAAASFAKLSLNLKLLEGVYRGRESELKHKTSSTSVDSCDGKGTL